MSFTEVRLRPTSPWRVGHGAGDRERVDVVYHSDALYSAMTHAMKTLGWLGEWLDATAESDEPAVRFSSLFPFIGKTRLITPPKSWWPPANPGRLYTEAAKLIPLEVIRNGIVDESRWVIDGETGCLVHAGGGPPVQISIRTCAAVDRLTGVADPHRIACLEFAANAGWWGVFSTSTAEWQTRVRSAFRLLADSGFGGERSRGWGRAATPEFSDGSSLLPRTEENGAWWMLSTFSPHASDTVDWSLGEYTAAQRGGWVDSQVGVAPKKQVRVIAEGSVLHATALRGKAVNVAPEGFPHPVYRSGIAFAIPVPPEPPMRPVQVATEPAETDLEIQEDEMVSEGGSFEPPPHAEISLSDALLPEAPSIQPTETELEIQEDKMVSEGAPFEPQPHAEVPLQEDEGGE